MGGPRRRRLTKLPDGKVLTEFDFEGLIPYGVYTLWNVVETEPFKDEPYTEFGVGKHAIIVTGNELWGPDADPTVQVSIEAFEPYLQSA